MGQIRKVLDNILNVLAGVSFIAMVVLTCWQVFTRYVMGDAATWTEELVTYLFAWMALLGASLVPKFLIKISDVPDELEALPEPKILPFIINL